MMPSDSSEKLPYNTSPQKSEQVAPYSQGVKGLDVVNVAVIGAGLTGLSAALRLHQKGVSVAVIESKSDVGGAISSEMISDGSVLEWGPHTIQNTGSDIMALIDELGITPLEADSTCKKRFIFYKGRLREVPSSLLSFLMTPLLSPLAKLRLLAEPIIPGSCQSHDETVSEWVTRRLGREVTQNLMAPFLSGVYAGDPARMSAVSVLKTLARWEKRYSSITAGALNTVANTLTKKMIRGKEDGKPNKTSRPYALINFNGGMQVLPREMAQHLPEDSIYCNEYVMAVEPEGNNLSEPDWYRVVTNRRTLRAQSVVCTAPAYVASQLDVPVNQDVTEALSQIPYAPMALVSVRFKRSDFEKALDGFGVLIPREEGLRLLGSIWVSCLFPKRAPKDPKTGEETVLLSCFVGGATDRAVINTPKEQLIEHVVSELHALLPLKNQACPLWVESQLIEQAIPQYEVGHRERVGTIQKWNKANPSCVFVGNYLMGVSLNDCVKQGNETAVSVFSDLESRQLLSGGTVREQALNELYSASS